MNTLKTLDKEISSYLSRLSPRQKQTILTVVKTFAEEGEEEIWNDESFIAEMDKRFSEIESGKVKTFSLEEVEEEARYTKKSTEQNTEDNSQIIFSILLPPHG